MNIKKLALITLILPICMQNSTFAMFTGLNRLKNAFAKNFNFSARSQKQRISASRKSFNGQQNYRTHKSHSHNASKESKKNSWRFFKNNPNNFNNFSTLNYSSKIKIGLSLGAFGAGLGSLTVWPWGKVAAQETDEDIEYKKLCQAIDESNVCKRQDITTLYEFFLTSNNQNRILAHAVHTYDTASSYFLLEKVLDDNSLDPKIAQQILSLSFKELPNLIQTEFGDTFLSKLIKKFPESISQFSQLTMDYITTHPHKIDTIAKYGKKFLKEVIEWNPRIAEPILPFLIKNFLILFDRFYGCKLLEQLLIAVPSCAYQLVPLVIEHFPNEKNESYDSCYRKNKFILHLLRYQCAKKHPQYEQLSKKFFDHTPLNILFKYGKNATTCDILGKNVSDKLDFEALLKKYYYLGNCIGNYKKKSNKNSSHKTQSVQHIKHNIRKMNKFNFSKIDNDPNVKNMCNKILQKELGLQENYYTFVHGQEWHFDLSERWFTQLLSIKNKRNYDEYIFPHVETPNKNLEEEAQLRKQILHYGCKGNKEYKKRCRARIQFLNWGFLANASNRGSNSLYYILDDHNVGTGLNGKKITLKTAFNDLGYGNIYTQYEKQLKALKTEHEKLSQYGHFLLFAIPKEEINALVYLTSISGSRQNIHIDGIGETDDITEIMETLRNNPEKIINTDRIEFALIKTYDKNGGLNPESGVKVFNFNAADPTKWEAYQAKENELFEQIRQSIMDQQKTDTSFEKTDTSFEKMQRNVHVNGTFRWYT